MAKPPQPWSTRQRSSFSLGSRLAVFVLVGCAAPAGDRLLGHGLMVPGWPCGVCWCWPRPSDSCWALGLDPGDNWQTVAVILRAGLRADVHARRMVLAAPGKGPCLSTWPRRPCPRAGPSKACFCSNHPIIARPNRRRDPTATESRSRRRLFPARRPNGWGPQADAMALASMLIGMAAAVVLRSARPR